MRGNVIAWMPHFHAVLNLLTITLMLAAWRAIRSGDPAAHQRLMGRAIAVMVLFVCSYLIYHSQVGITRFGGQGWLRTVYYVVLATHVLMALVALFLVPFTFFLGWRRRAAHPRVARWALPVWLYVSATGLVVYVMVYHLSGSAPG